nr:hypothetical protein BaRGS_004969 [Batillaria attramentaria]
MAGDTGYDKLRFLYAGDHDVEEEEDVICSEQDAMLNLWFTIAAALRNIFGIVIGLHVYKFGTRSARLTGWVVFGIGALMMAFADDTLPWLILPALLTLSYGGVTLLLTNVQVSGLFPTAAGVVVTLVSGAFDFSATTQLMVKILSESGVSRLYSYIGIAVLHGVLVLANIFMLTLVTASFLHPAYLAVKGLC